MSEATDINVMAEAKTLAALDGDTTDSRDWAVGKMILYQLTSTPFHRHSKFVVTSTFASLVQRIAGVAF